MKLKPQVLDYWMYRDNNPALGVVVYDKSGKYNFELKFFRLPCYSGNRSSETSLHEGRFKNYSNHTQQYGVQIVRTSTDQNENHQWFYNILEWIASYVEQDWSLDVEVHDLKHIEFDFRFSEVDVAVMFRLLFS